MTEVPKDLIDAVLRETLGPYGFDHSDVRADYDHDGEEALFIDAILKPNSDVEGKIYSAALGALSNALLERRDRRFPYLMLRHPDDEPAESPWPPRETAPS
ncbi:MAG: hypothetical protein ABSD08_03750 [Xanthobacteraceae bacterium]|jgi:hypothetical protein